MRDYVLLAFFPVMLIMIFRKPFVGVSLWIWSSLIFPNAWVYGIANGIRYNLLIVGCTIVSYIIYKNKSSFKLDGLTLLIILFVLWTTVTSITTISNPEVVWDIWVRFFKTIALFFAIIIILNKKTHIDALIWGVILSVGFFSFVEGSKFLASAGSHKIRGFEGHSLGDRNELAVAFLMCIPLVAYLSEQYKGRKIISYGLMGLMFMLIISVLGTHSRGGLIGLVVVTVYFVMKSERKLTYLLLLPIPIVIAVSLLPQEWFSRMDTIETADKDLSFMGRVIAWKQTLLLVEESPITGGGFKALENYRLWTKLSYKFDPNAWIRTDLPDPTFAHAAHSIYFQVLGDHGVIGLFIFLSILLASLLKTKKIANESELAQNKQWVYRLSNYMRISLVAYMISGAALSFAYFEGFYALLAVLTVLHKKILEQER